MNICIIASNYPSEGNLKHVFLEKIVKEFVDLGSECTVIAPQARANGRLVRKYKETYLTESGKKYRVYSPEYRNYSGRKIGFINLGEVTQFFFRKAVDDVYTKENIECDVFYSHFLPAGVTAKYMSSKYEKPFFLANGESNLSEFISTLSKQDVMDTFNNVSAIISVSTANKDEVVNSGYFDSKQIDKIHVLPNGINPAIFFPEDKREAREHLGIAEDIFVTIFVGSFSERKGSKRVAEALKRYDDVWSIFIGAGNEEPEHQNCIYKGRVENSKIRTYLSAADVFVLPTLNEGCCNAIVEALACGIPVISSNLPFNFDILDESCAILVDPRNIDEIANAISRVKDNVDLRIKMSKAAIAKARPFILNERAKNILKIMNEIR